MTQVSCPSANWCVAIGSYDGTTGGLIETLSGGSWTPTEVAFPANGIGAVDLQGVNCPAVGFCVAVGSYADTDVSNDGLIDTLSDGVWTVTEAPIPPDSPIGAQHAVTLGPLACAAAGSCVVFGNDKVTGPQTRLFIDSLSNGTWTATDAPVPSNAYSSTDGDVQPTAVSCPAVGSCVAVGHYSYDAQNKAGLLETLSNGSWSATEAPQPPSTATEQDNFLSAVACPAVGSCEAIGGYPVGPDSGQSDIESLSDGTWTETQAPVPSNASTETVGNLIQLIGLACPTVGSCEAVGSYMLAGSFATAPLIETLAGGSWNAVNASAGPSLGSLSCPQVGSCQALGDEANVAEIDTLASGNWTVTDLPRPSNSVSPVMTVDDLTCPVPGSCIAVGDYQAIGGNQEGLIETLLGSNGVSTSASTTSTRPALSTLTLGQADSDAATVAGNAAGGSPTGTVSFFVCGPTAVATPCTYQSNPVGTPVSLVPGAGNASTAASVSFTPPGGGYWCFAAYYSGDSHYSASFDASGDGCFLIPRAGSSVVLAPSASTVLIGQAAVTAVATIRGNVAHGHPTGTVNFYICHAGAAPAPCTSTDVSIGLAVTLTGGGGDTSTATSGAYTASPGTYLGYMCFAVAYSGDANYDPSSDLTTDGCFDVTSLTQTTVTDTPAQATITLGQSDTDTTTVSGNSTYGVPTGTVSYFSCGPTTAPAYCDNARNNPVGGPVNLSPATGADTAMATSTPFTPNTTGYWCFSSIYSGSDSYSYNNDPTVDQCVDVVAVPPVINSVNEASATAKVPFTFTVTATGSPAPTFTATGLPKWMILTNNGNGTATLKATKPRKGRHKITLTATSGGLSTQQIFTLTVQK
jgi:hypothetical protein